MKTMKKILSLTMILALALILAVPALAAEVTIVADPGEAGTDTGETYTAYKILDAAPLGETAEGAFSSVAYSIAKESPFYETIKNFGGESKVFTLYAKDTDHDVVTLADGITTFDAAELATALKSVIDDEANAEAVAALSTSFTGNKATLTDGYFLITSSLGSKMIVDTFGKENVSVNTKNEFPTLTELTADKTSAAFGDTVALTATVHIPATVPNGEELTVTVTLPEGFDFPADNSYAVSADNAKVATFSVTADGTAKDVEVSFDAVLNASSATGEPGNTVKAQLTHSAFTSVEAEATVYTYEFDLVKTDSAKNVLSGATFTLWNAETEGEQVALTADNCAAVSEGVITAGSVNIKGLAAGTYWLQEETAPTGYNRLSTRQQIVIEKNENATVTEATEEAPATYVNGGVQVINLTGAELPATGGVGTTIFYVVGGLLALGAVVVLVARKRVDNAE